MAGQNPWGCNAQRPLTCSISTAAFQRPIASDTIQRNNFGHSFNGFFWFWSKVVGSKYIQHLVYKWLIEYTANWVIVFGRIHPTKNAIVEDKDFLGPDIKKKSGTGMHSTNDSFQEKWYAVFQQRFGWIRMLHGSISRFLNWINFCETPLWCGVGSHYWSRRWCMPPTEMNSLENNFSDMRYFKQLPNNIPQRKSPE